MKKSNKNAKILATLLIAIVVTIGVIVVAQNSTKASLHLAIFFILIISMAVIGIVREINKEQSRGTPITVDDLVPGTMIDIVSENCGTLSTLYIVLLLQEGEKHIFMIAEDGLKKGIHVVKKGKDRNELKKVG